jgi:hypothetical protein
MEGTARQMAIDFARGSDCACNRELGLWRHQPGRGFNEGKGVHLVLQGFPGQANMFLESGLEFWDNPFHVRLGCRGQGLGTKLLD